MVGPHPCGSDHLPIIFENNGPPSLERVQRWKLTNNFSIYTALGLHQSAITEADCPMSLSTSTLKNFNEEPSPKTSTVPKRIYKPLLSCICKYAIIERNRALRRLEREPTDGDNVNVYRTARAEDRRENLLVKLFLQDEF